MKLKRLLISLPLLLSMVVSCVRQDLEDVYYSKVLIPVLIDWESKALMYVDNDPDNDLYSASVWLFPTADSEYQGSPLEYKMSDPELDYLDVPVGEYKVLIFNKTVGDYSSRVGFRGTDSFETFEYYTNTYSSSNTLFAGANADELYASEPDLLAAWTLADSVTFKVTTDEIVWYETVSYVRSKTKASSTKVTADDFVDLPEELLQLITITPERVVHNVTIEESVYNLGYASAAQATFRGTSSSVLLASREYSTSTTPYVVSFTSKYLSYYDDGCGLMSGSSNFIGPMEGDSNYSVETLFSLTGEHEGSTLYPTDPATGFYFDASSQVNDAEIGLDKRLTIRIDEGYELPIIIDAEGNDSFNVNVSDWDDPIVVPL